MRNSIIIFIVTFVIIGFNGCTVTSYYKVNSNLEYEYLPQDQRKTYEIFGQERLIKEVKDEDKFESFDEEFGTVQEESDPFETYNRAMTSFNDYFIMNLFNPVIKGYAKVVPETGREAISNFFENITFPIRFVNNVLQFKFYNAFEETQRFLVNTTFGLLGFMDPATDELNIQKHNEDFGQTLGYYGFGSGYHIVLPFFGPSNVRDIVGLAGDMYISPLNNNEYNDIKYKIPDNYEKSLGISVFKITNENSLHMGRYERMKEDAIDLYPFFKNIYTQNREKLIKE